MSERLEEIKVNWSNIEWGIGERDIDWLIEQAERAELLEMKYENSGSMFNRQNMQARIDELEKDEEITGNALNHFIGINHRLEKENKRYRELLTSKIMKDLIRLESKGCFLPDGKRTDFMNLKLAVEALESESE